MAVSGEQPFIKVLDSNGDPIVGAKLHVYEAGTTNYRAIYSNEALSTPLSNPLTGVNASNASGDFPRFYMAAGTYKLRAETSASVLIWEVDNIDTGLSAGAGALPISGGGTGATTAAAARAALDVPSNSELTDLSDQIADFSASLNSIVNSPGGRLTLTSNTPVLASSVAAATSVYYTPYTSDICPIYDGSQYILTQFAELTLTLHANHTASNIFDLFVFSDSGTVRIATGPAWSVATAGSGARGSGAGTTELTRLHGLWVNAYTMATARNGGTTYNIPANRGTYVGSMFMDGTNGQLTCHVAWGASRKFGLWNAYNRKPIIVKAGDSTASWSNPGATWRQSNNAAGNSIAVFSGLPEEFIDIRFSQRLSNATSSTTTTTEIGIGVNSATVLSGREGYRNFVNNVASTITPHGTEVAEHILAPTIGVNNINAIEQAPSGTTNAVFYGTEPFMLLAARWHG